MVVMFLTQVLQVCDDLLLFFQTLLLLLIRTVGSAVQLKAKRCG
jgi:hypothetical protein